MSDKLTFRLLGAPFGAHLGAEPPLEAGLALDSEKAQAPSQLRGFRRTADWPADVRIALTDGAEVVEALGYVSACQACAENATIAFEYLLDAVTACDPTSTEYVMCRPVCCPSCGGEIREQTLVLPQSL